MSKKEEEKVEKKHSLQDALKAIKKQFGDESIMKMWDNSNAGNVNTTHSGSYLMDLILGGGYPEGRVVEVYGPESSGKTTLTLLAIAEVQKQWWVCAFIDAEHAFDMHYAKSLGVNTDELLFAQPDFGEQGLQIAEELAKTGAVKLIVIDSVAALTPRAEIEWDMWASHMWLQARMMSQWLRKIAGHMSKSNTTVIFINQLRQKIGVIYGNPETTTWWVALKFYASQRIEVRKWEKIEENKEQIGYMAKVKVVKNKIFPPFKSCEVAIMFGKWVDKWMDILDTSVLLWLIPKAGAFYTLGKDKFQWREKAAAALVANVTLMKWLESQISDRIRDVRTGKAVIIDEKAIEASDDEEEFEIE